MESGVAQQGRPKSVVLFEVASLVIAVVHPLLHEGLDLFGDALQLVVWVGLTLWVTRGRSRAARAIYTGLLLFGTVGVIAFYAWGYISADELLMVVLRALAMLAVLLSLLWWPSTTTWLKGPHEAA